MGQAQKADPAPARNGARQLIGRWKAVEAGGKPGDPLGPGRHRGPGPDRVRGRRHGVRRGRRRGVRLPAQGGRRRGHRDRDPGRGGRAAVFGAALAHRLRRWLAAGPPSPEAPFPQLTERERPILDGVAGGLTNAQVGQKLFLSAKTVADNVSTILTKLQVSERGQAIVKAREAGLGRSPGGRD